MSSTYHRKRPHKSSKLSCRPRRNCEDSTCAYPRYARRMDHKYKPRDACCRQKTSGHVPSVMRKQCPRPATTLLTAWIWRWATGWWATGWWATGWCGSRTSTPCNRRRMTTRFLTTTGVTRFVSMIHSSRIPRTHTRRIFAFSTWTTS